MNYAEVYNNYIDIINNYKENPTSLPRYRVFEYLVALELKMLMWDDAIPLIEDHATLSRTSDFGTDLVSPDIARCAQVKSGKYAGGITYAQLTSYVTSATRVLDIHYLVLVVEKGIIVNYTGKMFIDKIISYDFDELLNKVPGTKVGIVINPYIKPDTLTSIQKVDEFYNFVSENGLPDANHMFSDTSRLYSYLNSYRRLRKFNLTQYDKLYTLKCIRKYYGNIYTSPNDAEVQLKQLKKYIDEHGEEETMKLCIWQEIKKHKMLHSSPELAQLTSYEELEKDYEEYHQVDQQLVRKINNIIRLVQNCDEEEEGSWLKYDFWVDCKNNELYNLWPYTKLLSVRIYNNDIS